MIAIADSGSTKTQWIITGGKSKEDIRVEMDGLNPNHVSGDKMVVLLRQAFVNIDAYSIDEVYFYGSGCSGKERCDIVSGVLSDVFPKASVNVYSDILGAAFALFGKDPGIAVILGTGSNTVIYDGQNITEGVRSLGYILGDEGSGTIIGREILKMFFRNQLSGFLKKELINDYNLTYSILLQRLYRKPEANRYLASFAPFAAKNKHMKEVAGMLDKVFDDYFKYQLLPLNPDTTLQLGVVGSVGFYFSDIFAAKAKSYGFNLTKILQHPVDGLKKYHIR